MSSGRARARSVDVRSYDDVSQVGQYSSELRNFGARCGECSINYVFVNGSRASSPQMHARQIDTTHTQSPKLTLVPPGLQHFKSLVHFDPVFVFKHLRIQYLEYPTSALETCELKNFSAKCRAISKNLA